MKVNNVKSISFQKKLAARCNIINNCNPQRANIYLLEGGGDDFYFYRAKRDRNWEDAEYLDDINSEMLFNRNPNDIFLAIEDEDENILGFGEISERNDSVVLNYLETAPNFSIGSVGRKIKYIGETMLAFIASLCNDVKKDLEIHSVADSYIAKGFYFNNCGFEDLGCGCAVLRKENFDKFLEQNARHTGSNIEVTI